MQKKGRKIELIPISASLLILLLLPKKKLSSPGPLLNTHSLKPHLTFIFCKMSPLTQAGSDLSSSVLLQPSLSVSFSLALNHILEVEVRSHIFSISSTVNSTVLTISIRVVGERATRCQKKGNGLCWGNLALVSVLTSTVLPSINQLICFYFLIFKIRPADH